METQSILVILVVGLVAGWLAGQIVKGRGMGLITDLAVGIVGAFIGSWILPRIGLVLGPSLLAAIVNATIGAVILLLIIRLVQRGGAGRRL
ncbi:MAG: GlsB/YeaQ/YmgE family stress response membrane protein [Devosia sp.]